MQSVLGSELASSLSYCNALDRVNWTFRVSYSRVASCQLVPASEKLLRWGPAAQIFVQEFVLHRAIV